MKNIMKNTALALALALSVGVPATFAKGKASAARTAAIKKCKDDYAAAIKDANKTKKGKDRSAAKAAAKATEKQCIASAPK